MFLPTVTINLLLKQEIIMTMSIFVLNDVLDEEESVCETEIASQISALSNLNKNKTNNGKIISLIFPLLVFIVL